MKIPWQRAVKGEIWERIDSAADSMKADDPGLFREVSSQESVELDGGAEKKGRMIQSKEK